MFFYGWCDVLAIFTYLICGCRWNAGAKARIKKNKQTSKDSIGTVTSNTRLGVFHLISDEKIAESYCKKFIYVPYDKIGADTNA